MQLQSVALQVYLGPEDNKFIFFALGLSAEVVVSIEMVSQLGVVVVKVLNSVSVTQETEEMFSSQVFEQLFIIKEARITELAQRMSLKQFFIIILLGPFVNKLSLFPTLKLVSPGSPFRLCSTNSFRV